MLLIGFLELFVGLIYLLSSKENSHDKFWKASLSASLAFWISNLIVWGGIMYINVEVREAFSSFNISGVNIMGANFVHYLLQVIAILVYIISNNKYSAWKKFQKNS